MHHGTREVFIFAFRSRLINNPTFLISRWTLSRDAIYMKDDSRDKACRRCVRSMSLRSSSDRGSVFGSPKSDVAENFGRRLERRLIDTTGRIFPSCILIARTERKRREKNFSPTTRIAFACLVISLSARAFHVVYYTHAVLQAPVYVTGSSRAREILLFPLFTKDVNSYASSRLYDDDGRTRRIKMSLF